MRDLHAKLMTLGMWTGCHQMPERSFFFRGKQFPVCARCTGAFLGYITGGVVSLFLFAPIWLDLLFCGILFADWLVQYICVLSSTNLRRLLTGILCGFGMAQLYIQVLQWLWMQLI